MKIIFSRHGNTFSPGEKVVWIGGQIDPPLVREGRRQARHLGRALQAARRIPLATFCSPLQRTRSYAEIALAIVRERRPPISDWRLDEIDYGRWNGLSNDEVIQRFGLHEFNDWYHKSTWPKSKNWKTDPLSYREAIGSFLEELECCYGSAETILVVTAHGPLKCIGRSLAAQLADLPAAQLARVDPGNICELEVRRGLLRPILWNEPPGALFQSMSRN
ncbi:histidine phosphatase family protein [Sinorhizobium meliloti]|uniref:histidine phosphatase family protein n=1 Tax=Rhizobium meliloti TaxID=382 RepID=UPI0013E2C59E|nr:histidine phosphatase family protein [Sinorhizobium meliloti]MDE3775498.1 histidine phosphatase family protein [Sinorhizobium meliloti]